MSHLFIHGAATIAQLIVALYVAMNCSSVFAGASMRERILAADGLAGCAIIMAIIMAIKSGYPFYLPIILVFALVHFAISLIILMMVTRKDANDCET